MNIFDNDFIKQVDDLAKRATELSAKYKSLKKIPDKKQGRWKPEMNEFYYTTNTFGEIWQTQNKNLSDDNYFYSTGNCYKTEQEAMKAKERMILIQDYKDFCEELNQGEEIDWEDDRQVKHGLIYDSMNENFDTLDGIVTTYEGMTYCLDSDLKDKAIEHFGEDKLKIIMGVD